MPYIYFFVEYYGFPEAFLKISYVVLLVKNASGKILYLCILIS